MRSQASKNGVDDRAVSSRRARRSPKPLTLLLIVAIVVAAIVGVAAASSTILGAPGSNYGCATITHDGNTLHVTTTGLIHRKGTQFYITCSEGATLPSGSVTVSCLTIGPQTSTTPYPGGSTTQDYYLSTQGGQVITLQGAPANATQVLQPNNAWLQVTC